MEVSLYFLSEIYLINVLPPPKLSAIRDATNELTNTHIAKLLGPNKFKNIGTITSIIKGAIMLSIALEIELTILDLLKSKLIIY